ncbi:MAG: transglycosylase SLT domain-containing protein [Rhodospirillaceae bacterium]
MLVAALPVPAGAASPDADSKVVKSKLVRPGAKPELKGRAVVRSLGQRQPIRTGESRSADPLGGDVFDISLNGLGAAGDDFAASARSKLAVRQLQSTATLVAHDCALAERGDPAAAYRLGRRYLFGMGVPRDKRMGVAWMRAAASNGHPQAIQVAVLVPRNVGRMRPWCRTGVTPPNRPSPPPPAIVKLVKEMAPGYGLDPRLVLAVIQVESAFHTNAVSPKEAAGLMQLIPETAQRFGVRDVFDPAENIRGGMKYLRWLLAYFEGDVTFALAGYNAGEGAVTRYGGVPPYAETRAYVQLVHNLFPERKHRFDATVATPAGRMPRQTADASR